MDFPLNELLDNLIRSKGHPGKNVVKPIRLVALAVAIFASSIVHANSPSMVSEEYEIQVTVDTSGHISSMQPEQNLIDDYMLALKQAAPKW